jgi:hypothetical protein
MQENNGIFLLSFARVQSGYRLAPDTKHASAQDKLPTTLCSRVSQIQ